MPGSFVIMALFKDGMADGVIIRDVDSAFVGEDAGFVLPVGEAGVESEGDGSVHGLEGLKYEGVIGRGGLNTIREDGVDDADKERWWDKIRGGEEIRVTGECVRARKEFARDMDHF